MTSVKKIVGARIRELRESRSLSQGMLARRANIDQRDVSAYENGRSWPRPERLDAIALALGVTVEMLLSFAARPVAPKMSPLALRAAMLVEHGLASDPELTKRVVRAMKVVLGVGAS